MVPVLEEVSPKKGSPTRLLFFTYPIGVVVDKRYFYDPDPYNVMRIIGEAIEQSIWPWNAGKVVVHQSRDFKMSSGTGIKLRFELNLLPDLPFVTYPNVLIDPQEMAHEVAQSIFKFYRYRPAVPVDDHIILGEE